MGKASREGERRRRVREGESEKARDEESGEGLMRPAFSGQVVWLVYAACCLFRYSLWTSRGVRYSIPECLRRVLYQSSIHFAMSS